MTFVEKLTAQIINNVQIKISHIHIRYEDSISTGTPLSFGITLNDFSVHTTDQNWVKCLVSQSLTEVYKVAQLESFAIYLNHNTKLFSDFASDNYLKMFQETIASKLTKPSDYDFSKFNKPDKIKKLLIENYQERTIRI
jgi:vacuolar protein sorting-associated protein 13A/C